MAGLLLRSRDEVTWPGCQIGRIDLEPETKLTAEKPVTND